MSKLYKHVSRFVFRRHVNKRRERLLKWALSLKPGDMINDCTGFNTRIVKIIQNRRFTGRGWFINDFDFTTDNGGCCSLMHCGVEPALSREKIETNTLAYLEHYISSGAMKHWFGDDVEALEKELKIMQEQICIIKSGEHIADEFGIKNEF